MPRVRRSARARQDTRRLERRARTGADEVAADAVAEVVEDAISVCLEHFRVRVEAGESELGDFLREELDAVRRVAEDDRLVDL